MFGNLKNMFGGKRKEAVTTPLRGDSVPLSMVNDPVFSQETLGKGLAIVPSEGKVFAPVDGVVEALFETKHAIALKSSTGIELLIHVGLDTVKLKGEPFTSHVKIGDQVKKGTLMLEFDLEHIKSQGYDPITPIIICNSAKYPELFCHVNKHVEVGDLVIAL